ncbi:hypothetical protein H072_8273 [Dactylellina haptotyla CBS 200.50]|uniref:Mid2 domain-containing protein n=1 Tax=Dactylellina haptotyla (strain CBS 200.50) TaxID=1284197 RepID=S8BFG7_DACHA|nr:hypothetical protein H072_8273 [Dactylellina haptotyla CBS 200.50]
MAHRLLTKTILVLVSIHLAAGSMILARQTATSAAATPTYAYTQDTLIKPTLAAQYRVDKPIELVWYIPPTGANANVDEAWNVTVALDGAIISALPQLYTPQISGEHTYEFTAEDTWPVSEKYQIIIFYDDGGKTLTSQNFGISGGGKTPSPTPNLSETPTATGGPLSSTSSVSTSSSSSSASAAPGGSSSIKPAVLGAAIGGAVVGTAALAGIVFLLLRRRKSKPHSKPKSNRDEHDSDGGHPSGMAELTDAGASVQPLLYQPKYQHHGAGSNVQKEHDTGVMTTSSYQGVNELPAQSYNEPSEMYSSPKQRAEVMGDTDWMPPQHHAYSGGK